MTRRIAILGSTGSIGVQTLEVVAEHPDSLRVETLAAGRNIKLLAQQIRQFRPKLAVVADEQGARALAAAMDDSVRIAWGPDALIEAATGERCDTVVMAVVGAVGVLPTLAALEAGKRVALANKETLVAAGPVVTEVLARSDGELIPVDSEHSALFQAMRGEEADAIHRLVLTASGGPFRDASLPTMARAGAGDALQHPTWDMGGKITIDSATLMNKGLEVIEAHWLFDIDYDAIDVLVHPQSIVHSLVEWVDGSFLAQMGAADMRIPIQYALFYPRRPSSPWERFDLTETALTFEEPDKQRFPALGLAYAAGKAGGTAPAVLNAANEVAVHAFLAGHIGFLDIVGCVETVLEAHNVSAADSVEAVLDADEWARRTAQSTLSHFEARS